ncbi:MAG TPA: BlaI/MecI/CopY family transcriptional regulator [Acidobacteriota bacterium]|nr:BlaI/MecI/CopY family transcriptional regulator [Acidobacteriota bacterium]
MTNRFVIVEEGILMKQNIKRPTDAELTILQVLWDRGPSTVREVYKILNSDRNVGYTTVLKFMQIMTDKGLVERDESCRPQLYRPCLPREQTERQLIKDLVDRAFGGSAKRLVMQALEVKKASPGELAQIEKLLNKLERGEK